MATTTIPAIPTSFIEEGKALGLTEEQVHQMWAKTLSRTSTPETTEVTRWVTCPECGHRASLTVSYVDETTGSTCCDECGLEFVNTFRFTKTEIAYFEEMDR